MDFFNSSSNATLLSSLKSKQSEIQKEVENLETKVKYIKEKPNLSEKICISLKNASDSLNTCIISSSPSSSYFKLSEISKSILEQERLISKYLNLTLESQAIPKLIQLFKLQVSINKFTEDFYTEKIAEVLESCKNKCKAAASSKAAEMAENIELIHVQNSQFIGAVKKNIDQLCLLIEPAIEKALNMFVVVQHSPTHKETEDFSQEKCDLEEKFREINNYLHIFSRLFKEFTQYSQDFDTFSEIENNDSVHRLEIEEFENKHQFSLDKSKMSREIGNDFRVIDEIVKIVDVDAENQKIHLKKLMKIMECLEEEHRKWEKHGKNTQRFGFDQVKFIHSAINDFFGLLKDSISTKDLSISKLEKIREKALGAKKHFRFDSSIFEDRKHSYIFIDPPEMPNSLSNRRYQEVTTSSKFIETSPFSYADNLHCENEAQNYYKVEKDSLENAEKSDEDLKAIQLVYESTINDLQQKDLKTQEILKKLEKKSKEFNSRHFSILKTFHQDFTLLKTRVSEELLSFSSFLGQKFIFLERKVNLNRMSSLSSMSKELEDLKDLNETLEMEKEALKDSFQSEIRRCMSENQELKKLNKDLKESLLKLSTKYESQNKLTSEILSVVNQPGDSLSTFKSIWLIQQKFVSRIQQFFNEKDLEVLSMKIMNRDVASLSGNRKFYSLINEIFQAFDKNLMKISTVFRNFTEKYTFKLEKCTHLLEIFKKIYENGVHGCLFDIDQQGNLSNDHSERIEELERSLIKYKNMERELQCIISTKTLELQESNENFNILQEFTENCIQVIEEVRNLCTGSEKFKDLLPAIHEILELHEKLL